jgi:similar to spore coat protein
MGILDTQIGNSNFDDRTIASDMLKDSKFSVFSLAQAITETADHQLRQLFVNQLLTSVQQHHQLSDLLIGKDWYQPFLAPQDQLSEDLRLGRTLNQ